MREALRPTAWRNGLGDQGHEGPRHAKRHQNNVEHQSECHLRSSPRDRIHGGEHGCFPERRDHLDPNLPINDVVMAVSTRGRNMAPYWVLRRSYSVGFVKIELAAGNVTSVMPEPNLPG